MDRLAQKFTESKEANVPCFVTYVCAGDPNYETSVEVCRTLIENGADILELGAPFSDPLADGITNQLAAQRSLEAGMTQKKVLELITAVRKFSEIPIVIYSYYNLIYSQGLETYVKNIREAGADGLLTLDLPPEEAEDLIRLSKENNLNNIFIIAPTTPSERIKIITNVASGFIYYVSREGVTGVTEKLADNINSKVTEIKKNTDLPVVVGFGISKPEQVKEISSVADGVVVGSALVNCIAENINDPAQIMEKLAEKISYLKSGII